MYTPFKKIKYLKTGAVLSGEVFRPQEALDLRQTVVEVGGAVGWRWLGVGGWRWGVGAHRYMLQNSLLAGLKQKRWTATLAVF